MFNLPQDLLTTLQLKDPLSLQSSIASPSSVPIKPEELGHGSEPVDANAKISTSCMLCNTTLPNVKEQRHHAKSDWHAYNLKQKLNGRNQVTENEFEKLIDDLEESISGSELSDSDSNYEQKDDTLTALLKRQAKNSQSGQEADTEEGLASQRKKRSAGAPPLIWFSTPSLPANTFLGIYRSLFASRDLEGESDLSDILRRKQLSPITTKVVQSQGSDTVPITSGLRSPQIFLCMIGGGHFAAMIVSLAPKMGKKPTGAEERQALVLAHKTFHRYTTRRKQGGSQSANDSAKGAAHSAGASIRRYNEAALETEIRALLAGWRDLIEKSELIFTRATGSTNRRTLFGPYDGQVLRHNDPRNRTFPFNTRRATQAELMRAFVELTRMKVSRVDEAALAAAAAADAEREASRANLKKISPKLTAPMPSKEEGEASLHTSQLQALIRRSKVPALLTYFSTNSLRADFQFHPSTSQAHHHTPTPLHFAASVNSPVVVLALLAKANANPTVVNSDGHPPFDLAGDRATRDAFRVARSMLGEACWDWAAAHCPPPLTKEEADQRAERDRAETEKEEAHRRKAETEKLKREELVEGQAQQPGKKSMGKALGIREKTAEERREEEVRGLTPELRMRLERERRARAAEERIRRMTGSGTGSDGRRG